MCSPLRSWLVSFAPQMSTVGIMTADLKMPDSSVTHAKDLLMQALVNQLSGFISDYINKADPRLTRYQFDAPALLWSREVLWSLAVQWHARDPSWKFDIDRLGNTGNYRLLIRRVVPRPVTKGC